MLFYSVNNAIIFKRSLDSKYVTIKIFLFFCCVNIPLTFTTSVIVETFVINFKS